jgi:hypothetical protein
MENRPVNISGVTGSVVSIGTAGAITNNVNAPARGDAVGGPAKLRDDLVVETLLHILPHHCDFIGDSAVRQIAAGPVEIVRAEHGSNLDLSRIIVVVEAGAKAIRQGIETYQALSAARAGPVTADELKEAIEAAPHAPPSDLLGPEIRNAVIRYLADHLSPELVAELAPPRSPGVRRADAILVVSADPVDLPRLRLHNEDREIREVLALSGGRERWVVQPWGAARLRDLTRALMQSKPRVVHFSGHGNGEGGIFLEDESGRAHSIPLDALKVLFAEFGKTVECAVLNACFSEPQARAIAENVPYVVGTAQAVPDEAAIEYSVGFYTALGEGRSFPEAHAVGCVHFQSTPGNGCPPPVLISAQPVRAGAGAS